MTTYLDPGTYIVESVVPSGVSVNTVPLTVCLIGIANRNKRVSNEALTRGTVSGETLTVASTSSAHDSTLAHIGNRQTAQTSVTKDGVLLDTSLLSYRPATVIGNAAGTFDFSTNNLLSLSFDGKTAVTIKITTGGADLTTISNGLITQRLLGLTIAAVTAAQVVDGINKALGGSTSLGYGSAYAAVASVDSTFVRLTSPISTPLSDIRLYASYPTALSQTAAIFGVSLPYQAPTVLRMTNAAYGSSAVYKASYVSTNTDTDAMANVNIQTMVRVGSFAGVTTFKEATDYQRTSNTIDWSINSAAVFTSSVAAATYDVSTNDTIILAFDGKAAITIDVSDQASPPPGYTAPSSSAAATDAELVININSMLANSATYGPAYATACTTSGNKLILTSPNKGTSSIVEIAAPALLSASTALFGLATGQMPYDTFGTASRPVPGAIYFATYEYTRPIGDYNLPKRYFTPDSLFADIGQPTLTNQLAIAGQIAFDNKAPSVIVVQVNDTTFNGAPTTTEVATAIDAAGTTAAATEICVLNTNLTNQVKLVDHVTSMSSSTQKDYRRGWFGMARATTIGDKDTAGTFLYEAIRTLQVPGDSPGRGRLILVAPGSVDRSITLEDGSSVTANLDGSYLAVAIAAKMTSFTSPAETLLRKTITGFDISTFPTYLKAERALLAGNGVTVVTLDAGKLVLTDPLSTEAAAGGLIEFEEISAITQKDAVTTAMTAILEANLVGIVPSDLASFIATIKGLIGSVLRSMIASGAIAPFRTVDGISRDVDFASDIQVFQSVTDPTSYNYKYYYNLRYPAKRFFGVFTVDTKSF